MAINNIVDLLNSPIAQATANASQYTDLILNLKQVSNDEIMQELEHQNKKYLELLCNYSEKQIIQNEKIISQNEQLLNQNIEIISLFKGGIK